MQRRVSASPEAAARATAEIIAGAAEDAILERGHFVWAVSGGSTPAQMLSILATFDVAWHRTHLFQVDERIAPDGDPARNDTMIRERLVEHCPAINYHPMPVTADDVDAALADYLCDIETLTGQPALLDLIQLGLGSDGHTASLVPDDPVLDARGEFAVTNPYRGTRRATMTAALINRARQRSYLVTGDAKREALTQLLDRDPAIPATLITSEATTLITDQDVGD